VIRLPHDSFILIMPTLRKILIFGDAETLADDRPMGKIRIFAGKPHVKNDGPIKDDDPTLILYYAPGEEISSKPNETIESLKAEGVIQKGRIAARNPAIHGEYSFVIQLSTVAASLIAGWLAGLKGRKIEIQKGDMKVSAPTVKKLEAALALLHKYEKARVLVKKANSKQSKKSCE
jgi:hypothetical protein